MAILGYVAIPQCSECFLGPQLLSPGLLPIYQWLTSLERMPPPTRSLLTIERLQGWSMLLYYPFEHLYYLRSNGLLPATISLSLPFIKALPVKLDTTKLALWSTRAWAVYVFLQLAHLREDGRLLKLRERALTKVKGKSSREVDAEQLELSLRRNALLNEFIANLGNLPLTIHWCVSCITFWTIVSRCTMSLSFLIGLELEKWLFSLRFLS